MKRKPLSELQQQIMKVIASPAYPVIMSATELGEIPATYPGRLSGPLGGLRKRGLLKRTKAASAPLQIIYVSVYGRKGLEWRNYMPRPWHYIAVSRAKFAEVSLKLRRGCAQAYWRRFHKLSYNQQQQALIGNWNA